MKNGIFGIFGGLLAVADILLWANYPMPLPEAPLAVKLGALAGAFLIGIVAMALVVTALFYEDPRP